MTFYRDSRGNEVDMILESGREFFPVEVNAGATIAEDFFKGLKHFSRVAGVPSHGCGLIYSGKDVQQRGNSVIYPIIAMEEMFEKLNQEAFKY